MFKGAKDELKMELRNHIEYTKKKDIAEKILKEHFYAYFLL